MLKTTLHDFVNTVVPRLCESSGLNVHRIVYILKKVFVLILHNSACVYACLKFEVNRNYIGIYVYYKDLTYTLISEAPNSEIFDLISNIGGLVGVFLGISFLSFVELIEILFEVFLSLLCRQHH